MVTSGSVFCSISGLSLLPSKPISTVGKLLEDAKGALSCSLSRSPLGMISSRGRVVGGNMLVWLI
jgi:hypothetical protein